MSSFYMQVDVNCSDIASKMHSDTEFAYNLLADLAENLYGHYDWFADELFKNIFEDENTEILLMLSAIVKQFEHLKEEDEVSDTNPSVE